MDKTIFNYLVTKPNIARAAAEMPEDYMEHIIDLISPPFDVTTQEDKELMVFFFITSLLKWLFIEGEPNYEIDSGKLLELLESVYDEMPQYRVSRFCE